MMGFLPISLLVIWLGTRSANAQGGLLFPHGAGDTSVANRDDYYSAAITIPVQFPFFGQTVSSAYVSTNGVISFGTGISTYTPQSFPLASSMLAVFWGDGDIRNHGTVTYRPYLRTLSNEDVFDRAEAVIRQAFGNQFTASWMLIATWNQVPFYGSSDSSITNTFQAVIITDGTLSFAMYNYQEIAWTTGTASGGNSNTGLGGYRAQVGYNANGGANYTSVPGSMTDAIVNIDQRSNIGTRGRWLFRINTDSCATYNHPTYGRVGNCTHTSQCLNNAYVSGLCPTKCNNIKCCFENAEAECGQSVRNKACEIKYNPRISLYSRNNGDCDGADAKSNIWDTCKGKKSLRSSYSCSEGSSPGGSVCLSLNVLEYILSLADDGHDIQVNAISGSCHSTTSRHYRGTAVDFQIVASSNYTAWMAKCTSLGAVENLGPPTRGHASHTHCAFAN